MYSLADHLRITVAVAVMGVVPAIVTCDGRSLQPSSDAPSILECNRSEACPSASPTIAWVFTTDDCLRCLTFPKALRTANARLNEASDRNPAFSFLAIHVSDTSVSWLSQYFARRRLPAIIKRIETDEYRETFRRSPTPALYFVRGGKIDEIFTVADSVTAEDITDFVEKTARFADP